jgi:hypothetical protein
MIQRRQHFRFALESGGSAEVVCERSRQDLDRPLTIQFGIPRAVPLTHTTGADGREDLVWIKFVVDDKRHMGFS